ncbi:MAG: response regulator [Campylobacterales bacterium]|nr:response regulator [Campylobacterales bacterium]
MESLKELTILYAEDESTIRMLTDRMLSKRVKKIVSVENAEAALEAFDELNPDVLITDLEMGGIGGEELIEMVRGKNTGVKTIILSGSDEADHSGQADVFMVKPINKKRLFEVLESFAN